jgi:hypothetical protein
LLSQNQQRAGPGAAARIWDRLRTELPPRHVPGEVYAIAEVYVHRMAATAPPYSRPGIVRGEQCAGAPLIESGQEHQQPPM